MIIGVGGIAKLHARALRELGIEIVGSSCRTAPKGEAFVAEFDSAHLALNEICVQFECLNSRAVSMHSDAASRGGW